MAFRHYPKDGSGAMRRRGAGFAALVVTLILTEFADGQSSPPLGHRLLSQSSVIQWEIVLGRMVATSMRQSSQRTQTLENTAEGRREVLTVTGSTNRD